ncbi:MAG TPA: DUF3500 domain-containing protein [Urbifossiella sp.]|nr:DUF3500 domain-containing protein [Urbifossiella sp.]
MLSANKSACPECEHGPESMLGRRDFIRVLGASAVAAALPVTPLSPLAKARAARAEKQAAAEQLIFELFSTMDADQKQKLVLPWDAKKKNDPLPSRLMTANAPVGKSVIGLEYNKKQVELLDRIFRSIANGEEGYRRLSRNGKFDNTGSFEQAGCLIYGDPAPGKKFSLVFTSHHLTVRCDGNSEEKTAFGGPLYYGHSPSGYAKTNVFFNQTQAASAVFSTLTEEQKKTGLLADRTWKDGVDSVKLPASGSVGRGLAFNTLSKEQKAEIEKLMRELVSPYRKEDGDEVMEILKANGGLEKTRLAFYTDKETGKQPWSYWRLEGPGFVWSYRALPHIHTFVNISSKLV